MIFCDTPIQQLTYKSTKNRQMFIFNHALQPFKAYCAMWVRSSNFRHRASPRVSPRDSTQRRKVELWARKCPGNFA